MHSRSGISRGYLASLGNQIEAHAVLAAVFLEGIEGPDDLRHVAHFIGPLADHAAVDHAQVVPVLTFVSRRGQKIVHHALQILQAEAGGVHGVGIAHGFRVLPESAPCARSVVKRSQGVLSCSRAHLSSVLFSSSEVLASLIGA